MVIHFMQHIPVAAFKNQQTHSADTFDGKVAAELVVKAGGERKDRRGGGDDQKERKERLFKCAEFSGQGQDEAQPCKRDKTDKHQPPLHPGDFCGEFGTVHFADDRSGPDCSQPNHEGKEACGRRFAPGGHRGQYNVKDGRDRQQSCHHRVHDVSF